MKKLLSALLAAILFLSLVPTAVFAQDEETEESYTPVTFENVKLHDEFWSPKQKINSIVSLEKGITEIRKPSGGLPNFHNAISKLNGEAYSAFQGYWFQDTDIYKSIEAMSYTLALDDQGDEEIIERKQVLRDTIEEWIPLIEQVQLPEGTTVTRAMDNKVLDVGGYLDTYYVLNGMENAWTDIYMGHEMYTAGHFFEAVDAYTRMSSQVDETTDMRLYNVAIKLADHIESLFGPSPKMNEVPGHEEIELGLVKLSRLVTAFGSEDEQDRVQKYLDLAEFFIDGRGHDWSTRPSGMYGGQYSQDHMPFVEQTEAVGHAVRGVYLFTGAADVASTMEAGEKRDSYLNALNNLWENVTGKKMYITGGIGSTGSGEAFGANYELPNLSSYCETCASIGNAMWNQRMNMASGDAKYIDVMEKCLYNGMLVGVNLEGNRFNYSNKLESTGGDYRSEWFACACCPPNLMRTMAALGGYMYATSESSILVNLFIDSTANITVGNNTVELVQETNYPWEGSVNITVNPDADASFALKVRVPSWGEGATFKVNGEAVTPTVSKGYATFDREWKAGDTITMDMPLEVRRTEADPNVTTNEGKIAIERGPLVYCIENAGNSGNARNYIIPDDVTLEASYDSELLNGVVKITGTTLHGKGNNYRSLEVTAVPYYAWNNRENGEMIVWVPKDKTEGVAETIASRATASTSYISSWEDIRALNDLIDPTDSTKAGAGGLAYGNWDAASMTQWIQYDFDRPYEISSTDVYWWRDGAGINLPASWYCEYWDEEASEWKEVEAPNEFQELSYPILLDQYSTCQFKAVTTTKLRVTIERTSTHWTGVLEWRVNSATGSTPAIVEYVPTTCTVNVGEEPVLPATVTAVYDDGYETQASVTWDSIDPESYAQPGNFVVKGVLENYAEVEAYITVLANEELNTKYLEYVIQYAEEQKENGALDGLMEIVKTKFEEALVNAKDVLVNAVSQSEIDTATTNLLEVIHMLDFKVDKTELQSLVDMVSNYLENEDKYTPSTFTEFKEKLEAAKAVLDDPAAMKDEVDQAWNDLAAATAGLRYKPNKDLLNNLINQGRAKNLTLYTVSSVTPFKNALEKAEEVSKNENSDEEQVKNSYLELHKTMDSLEPLPVGSSTDTNLIDDSSDSSQDNGQNIASTSNPKTGDISSDLLILTLVFAISLLLLMKKRKD